MGTFRGSPMLSEGHGLTCNIITLLWKAANTIRGALGVGESIPEDITVHCRLSEARIYAGVSPGASLLLSETRVWSS